jgi:3',5'-cyclic AMP phosphodiesterase CpdA
VTARDWPVPPEAATVHLIGDVQTALPSLYATSMRQGRRDKLAYDFRHGQLPTPAGGHLTVGDLIHRGMAAEDADAAALFGELTANTGAPVHKVMGNHDIYDNLRTPSQWATAWGLASPSYTVDLPWVRLIILGIEPLRDGTGTPGVLDQGKCYLSTATIAWLDAQLQATTKDCWIVCHAPLRYTVSGTATEGWLRTDGDLDAVLAANPNAKAWISGHTHTALSEPDVFVTTTVNGRLMAHINAGAVANDTTPTDDVIDWTTEYHVPMRTFWVTYVDSDRYELRTRDHGAGAWVPRDASTGPRLAVITL